MESTKDKDGTQWVSMTGGLYLGRTLSGTVRIAVTNGLPPFEPKASPTFVEVQPEAFRKAADWLLAPAGFGPSGAIVSRTVAIGALDTLTGVIAKEYKHVPCAGAHWVTGQSSATLGTVAICSGCHKHAEEHPRVAIL